MITGHGDDAEGRAAAPLTGPRRTVLFVACGALALGVFVLDTITPRGVAWGTVYILVPLAGWRLHRRTEIQLMALACTVMMLGALALKPPGDFSVPVGINRGLALLALWSVALLIVVSRRAERQLAASRRRTHAIVHTAVDSIITIDAAGIIQSCNAATETMFGYHADEILGRNVSILMPNPYRAEHDGYLHRYLETGERRIIGIGREVVAQRKDGSTFPIDLGVSEFRVDDKVLFCGIVHDVTDRKTAEAALERANRTLSERNRELQNIVYVTSHDLRSPLVNIQGFGRELERACKDVGRLALGDAASAGDRELLRRTVVEDIPESLHYILSSATKMETLLAGLLRLSRLGRAALRIERLDMNALVANVLRSIEYQVQTSGARIDVDDLPPCAADASQVTQVFSNLLDNALKYRAPERTPEIRITGRRDGASSEYRVIDNGIGIAPAHQDRVFEIFHRLDTTRAEGDGLGLTIVQRIVERHEGSIAVESEPGRGSTFVVRLPADPPLTPPEDEPEFAAAHHQGKRRHEK